MMEQGLVPGLVGLTSVAACLIGVKGLGLPVRGIGRAFRKMCEGVGIMLVFLGANLMVGILMILASRAFAGGFVSLYLVADAALLPLSIFQGLVFQWWWDRERRPVAHLGGGAGPK